MTGPAEPDLRTRIAFQAIQFPDSENTVTALANTLQLEQGSAGGE